eukprot:CAMPEP_0116896164 /NCGR_PEP_ID=MMETSP0467-20121206/5479_1 /TAXON_ID=283647 /ORGANISM="Mesodinium pulex, Strain SPMC105" /LENGTH=81 /DNA_ID=CAMNT_0004567203 /DNA_START=379 /DNA_END=624 /DNA_ORIENTATION=-
MLLKAKIKSVEAERNEVLSMDKESLIAVILKKNTQLLDVKNLLQCKSSLSEGKVNTFVNKTMALLIKVVDEVTRLYSSFFH